MKPTILLAGKNGQIGFELHKLLSKLGQVIAPNRIELDLSKPESIQRTVQVIRPQLIVNAAAYTAVDAAQTDEASAHAVNAKAPAIFAEEAQKIGAALVHYSTDYVFDGTKKAPYEESDPANPINVYGKTKFAGEQAIRNSGVPHLILRTSWVYATRGRNFLLTILRLATEREELRIVCDQIGAPTCAADIAAATAKILTNTISQDSDVSAFPKITGTYHMAAAGETTWCDFAKAILAEAARALQDVTWVASATRGRPLISRRVIPITTAEYGSPTPRPAYSALSNSFLTQVFGVALPDWRTQLHQCFGDTNHDPVRNCRVIVSGR